MPRVPITDEMRAELHRLREESGLSGQRLLKGRRDLPIGLSSSTISSWLSGKVITAKSEHLEFVLELWRNADPIVAITDGIVKSINEEFERSGVGLTAFVKMTKSGENLSLQKLQRIKAGKHSQIRKSHFDQLLEELRELPDRTDGATKKARYMGHVAKGTLPPAPPKHERLNAFPDDLRTIEDSELKSIRDHINRTGVQPTELFKRNKSEAPDKLHASTVSQWLNGHIKRTSPSRLAWVLSRYEKLPDGA